jgi:acyl CoA:acetate/3-ketoacid CoA transferase beta subunit/acyl CoA:acetate/3-ketoacid CoA transferase alpha subunit
MKLHTLEQAVRAHVRPGMHLNFASTPSRSNASVREVARQFKGKNPRFEISSTGFHSALHLLALLRLGARYVACFFGDNYPVPRPNDLYTELEREGAEIEMWSLWSYVSALRAGALGQPDAVTTSLVGTSMGEDLARAGKLRIVAGEGGDVALVKAIRSDITFVHGLLGDAEGNVVFSPPHSEGFWGAIGARTGVIATVERTVSAQACAQFSDAMKIPPHRVLAVCEAPFGTHPQPLYAAPRFGALGYTDDFEHYERWRMLTQDRDAFAIFVREVLDAEDPELAYRNFVGEERLDQLVGVGRAVREEAKETPQPSRAPSTRPRAGPLATPRPFLSPLGQPTPHPSTVNAAIAEHRAKIATGDHKPVVGLIPTALDDASGPVPPLGKLQPSRPTRSDAPARANEILLVLSARAIASRVRQKKYPIILAGIGHAFLAARMAKLWLEEEGIDVKVMVETGLFDLECGPRADEFLLSYRNTALAKRHSSVEDILGTITCGADSVCLGVIGAAQIDTHANVNSSRINNKILVGSGGANDITSSAAEVIVLTRCSRSRLVDKVEYVTSPGRRILTVATDLCTLRRDSADAPWYACDVYPAHGGRPVEHAIDVIKSECVWPFTVPDDLEYAQLISTSEMATVHKLDPFGVHWRRER